MSRASTAKIDGEKLLRLLEIVGGGKKIAEELRWNHRYFEDIARRGRITLTTAEDLEKRYKIRLMDYIDLGSNEEKVDALTERVIEKIRPEIRKIIKEGIKK